MSKRPLAVGDEVQIDLALALEKLEKIQGRQVHIKISGKVVRLEKEGVAVSFKEDYQIFPLEQSEAGKAF